MSNVVKMSDYVDGLTNEEVLVLFRALSMAIYGRPIPKVYEVSDKDMRNQVFDNLVDVADVIGPKVRRIR